MTTIYRWAVVLENNYIKIMYNHNCSVLYSWKSVMGYIEANIKSVMEHILLFLCQLFVPSSSFSSHFCSSVWKFSITFLKAKNTWASQIPATSSLRHSAAPLSHTPCPTPNQEPVHKATEKAKSPTWYGLSASLHVWAVFVRAVSLGEARINT